MRRIYLLTMVVALVAPVAVLTAGPASAAGGTTCGKPSGTITISPGLTSTPTVQTISVVLPVKACKGGGVTGGTSKGSLKTAAIDISTFANGKPITLNDTITWNTKATTTFSATTNTKISSSGAITATIKGKVTKGLFVGGTVTATVNVKLGPLVHNAIKNLIITGTTAFVIT
ncbi:MAG: hypothetical protein ACLPVY_22310 [Acidimicrobiia bacterium]